MREIYEQAESRISRSISFIENPRVRTGFELSRTISSSASSPISKWDCESRKSDRQVKACRSLFLCERTQRRRKPSETLPAKARPYKRLNAADLNTWQEIERIVSHDKKSTAT
jgi:hypothetical protein